MNWTVFGITLIASTLLVGVPYGLVWLAEWVEDKGIDPAVILIPGIALIAATIVGLIAP